MSKFYIRKEYMVELMGRYREPRRLTKLYFRYRKVPLI